MVGVPHHPSGVCGLQAGGHPHALDDRVELGFELGNFLLRLDYVRVVSLFVSARRGSGGIHGTRIHGAL